MYKFLKFVTALMFAIAFVFAISDDYFRWGFIPATLGILGMVGIWHTMPTAPAETVEENI